MVGTKWFIEQVLSPLRSGSYVGVSIQGEINTKDGYKDALITEWLIKSESYLSDGFLAHLQEQNNRNYYRDGLGSIFWLGASRKASSLTKSKNPKFIRGSLNDLEEIACFWADFDTDKNSVLKGDVVKGLLNMPCPPSIIYDTGGGLQCVHLLDSAIPIDDYYSATEYSLVMRGFYSSLVGDMASIDNKVYNADRMMRLVGFNNRKVERNNAPVHFVHTSEIRYSFDHLKSYAGNINLSPEIFQGESFKELPESSVFIVGNHVWLYLVSGLLPEIGKRHNTMRAILLECASSGIPKNLADHACRRMAEKWQGQTLTHSQEYINLLQWAYGRPAYQKMPMFSVVWNSEEQRFIPAIEKNIASIDDSVLEQLEKHDNSKIVPIEPVFDDTKVMDLESLRKEQYQTMLDFVNNPSDTNIGEVLVIKTPPATGKSYASVNLAESFVKSGTEEKPKFAAFFQMFTQKETEWSDWVRSNGGDPSLWFYFVGRNSDKNSCGYCAFSETANLVANRGYSVNEKVCARCPYKLQCTNDWYLSQFEKAKKSPIVIYRHQHGRVEDFVRGRGLAIFDETVLGVFQSPIRITLNDLSPSDISPLLAHQFPVEVDLVKLIEDSFRLFLASNVSKQGLYGGKPILDGIIRHLPNGVKDLEDFCSLPDEFIERIQDSHLENLTGDSALKMPFKYMVLLRDILRIEVEWFLRGATHWNSRFSIDRNALVVYPVDPFIFPRKTRVVVADATADTQVYDRIFRDKQGNPFLPTIYERELPKKGSVVQVIGTENTRGSLSIRKRKDDPENSRVESIETLVSIKSKIEFLSQRHPNDMLIITYKALVPYIKEWANEFQINPQYVLHFGSLRGTNAYENVSSAVVVGRQRKPDHVLIAETLAMWWEHPPLPLSRLEQIEPFVGVLKEGRGLGYRYNGWLSKEINRAFLSSIQSETIQSAHRIRMNSSLNSRFLYLISAFPTLPPDILVRNSAFERDLSGVDIFESAYRNGEILDRTTFVNYLIGAGVPKSSAYRVWDQLSSQYAHKVENVILVFNGAKGKLDAFLRDNPHHGLTDSQLASKLGLSISTIRRNRHEN